MSRCNRTSDPTLKQRPKCKYSYSYNGSIIVFYASTCIDCILVFYASTCIDIRTIDIIWYHSSARDTPKHVVHEMHAAGAEYYYDASIYFCTIMSYWCTDCAVFCWPGKTSRKPQEGSKSLAYDSWHSQVGTIMIHSYTQGNTASSLGHCMRSRTQRPEFHCVCYMRNHTQPIGTRAMPLCCCSVLSVD